MYSNGQSMQVFRPNSTITPREG